jgi:hypothetical protein
MARGLTAQDKKWRAESDLRTLREAAELQGNKTRLKAAETLAKKELQLLKKISKKK